MMVEKMLGVMIFFFCLSLCWTWSYICQTKKSYKFMFC